MTRITINGQARTIPGDTSLGAVVAAETGRVLSPDGRPRDGSRLGIAAAKNSQVIPRSRWFSEVLIEGDTIELVTATQGG